MNFIASTLTLCAILFASYSSASLKDEVLQDIKRIQSKIPEENAPWKKNWITQLAKVNSIILNDRKLAKQEREDRKHFAHNYNNVGTSKFYCPTKASSTEATSVHKLTPSDIKMVAAIGDSLTAGNGALANTILGLLIEYRGDTFNMGGKADLEVQVSVPNILKKYNSNLTGYSTGSGSVMGSFSKLNLAEAGNVASDLPRQAQNLINKMKLEYTPQQFQNDWKLISVFVGGNDLCDYCKDKSAFSTANYKKNIQQALDLLHSQVPRAFVNLLEVVDVGLVEELKDGTSTCFLLLGSKLCTCAANPESAAELNEVKEKVKEYQAAVRELGSSGRYDTKDDFTVVVQPFFRNSVPPRINGKYDLSYFAPDCFHFSAKGHAEAAKALWKNMLEPVGKKSDSWSINSDFKCPTKDRPYFATYKN